MPYFCFAKKDTLTSGTRLLVINIVEINQYMFLQINYEAYLLELIILREPHLIVLRRKQHLCTSWNTLMNVKEVHKLSIIYYYAIINTKCP